MDSAICLYTKVELEACKLHFCNTKRLLWKRSGRKMGTWGLGGLLSEKFVRTKPSRMSENALLEHRVNVAINRSLRSQKEN